MSQNGLPPPVAGAPKPPNVQDMCVALLYRFAMAAGGVLMVPLEEFQDLKVSLNFEHGMRDSKPVVVVRAAVGSPRRGPALVAVPGEALAHLPPLPRPRQ